jgi:acyl-CoA thioester hydrolase
MVRETTATHDADGGSLPDPRPGSPRFAAYFKVRHYEMDALGHVNNAVYLHYLEQAAYEHSAAAGFPDERTRALGGVWIVRKHEIEYLRPASGGDVLQVVTWAVEFKGARAVRDYAIFRYEGQSADARRLPADNFLPPDQELPGDPLVRARTLWVWADLATARPRRIPAALYPAFFATTETD